MDETGISEIDFETRYGSFKKMRAPDTELMGMEAFIKLCQSLPQAKISIFMDSIDLWDSLRATLNKKYPDLSQRIVLHQCWAKCSS